MSLAAADFPPAAAACGIRAGALAAMPGAVPYRTARCTDAGASLPMPIGAATDTGITGTGIGYTSSVSTGWPQITSVCWTMACVLIVERVTLVLALLSPSAPPGLRWHRARCAESP